ELRIAKKIKETPVRFASPAVEPQKPVIPKPKLYIAVAAVLGLFLGIILAFLVEHLEATKEEKEK
ncbi:MAG: lipopolysaccharide biosynthesis protein, partial [Deltaproteobacteria bacterium]